MSKRPAELSLEDEPAVGSPVSKKARVEDELEEGDPRNGALPLRRASGQEMEEHERKGQNILAAADHEEEEMEEAMNSWRRGFMRWRMREGPTGSHQLLARAEKCESSFAETEEVE